MIRYSNGKRRPGTPKPGGTGADLAIVVGLVAALVTVHLSFQTPAARAAGSRPARIEKTFDYGTLIEHTISVERGPYWAALHLRQRRQAEDSATIIRSNLAYQYRAVENSPPMPTSLFEAILTDLIQTMHDRFGADLKIESLGSGGFMGLKEIEKRSILAFADYEPWQKHLQDPQRFSQLEIYTIVKTRWQEAGVFEPVAAALAPLGYTATFAGFEKLFVFPAEKCSFYQELAPVGIQPSDRFPTPGSIAFTLTQAQ